MPKHRAIIFDLFGTLTIQRAAPEDRIIESWKLYQRRGFDYERVEDVVCGTACSVPFTRERRYAYYQTLIDKLGLPENSHQRIHNIIKRELAKEKLVSGALSVLGFARKSCDKLAMVSDLPNPDWDLPNKLGFADSFDFRHLSYDPKWVNHGDYERVLKPDPAVFRRIVNNLGVDCSDALMIGNSLHSDIEPARVLGMRAILVDFHKKYPEDPDRVESLEELREVL